MRTVCVVLVFILAVVLIWLGGFGFGVKAHHDHYCKGATHTMEWKP